MEGRQNTEYAQLWFFAFVTSLLAYGFSLIDNSLTIDSEAPIYSEFSMSLGRWGANLIRFHLFHGHLPYFTLLLGLVFFALTAVELSRIFTFNGLRAFLFCALFVTIPQMSYQFAFTMQADYIPFGLYLAALAFRLYQKSVAADRPAQSSLYLAGASLLLMFVTSIYQALPFLVLICFIGLFFQNASKDGFNLRLELRRTLVFAGFLLAGGLLYYISVRLICPMVESGHLTTYTSGDGSNRLSAFLELWGKNLIGGAYYGEQLFGLTTIAAIVLMVTMLINKRFWAAVALVFLLLVPFFISFFITNGYHPPRIYIATGIVFAFLLVTLLPERREKAITIFTGIVCLTNMYFITKLFFSNHQVFTHDKTLAHRIDDQIYNKYPEFNPKSDYVYFFGCLPYEEHGQYRLHNSEIFGGSFFNWDNGSNYRIHNFLRYTDIADYRMVDNKGAFLKIQDSISPMPTWPDRESIKKFGNIVVVKLGPVKGMPLPVEY